MTNVPPRPASSSQARESQLAPVTDLPVAELIATLSLATDLANGFTPEQGLRTCLLAVNLANALALDPADVSDTYYLALLRAVASTCMATEEAAAAGGDDIALRNAYELVDAEGPVSPLRRLVASGLGRGEPALQHAARLLRADKCMADADVAMGMARRLHMSGAVVTGLGQADARWDGKGMPRSVSGDGVLLPVRIVQLAHVVEMHHRTSGWQAAVDVARGGAGHRFDPQLVQTFAGTATALLEPLEAASAWDVVMDAEPVPRRRIASAHLDDVARAFADFADLKSTFTVGHSSGVAELAERAGAIAGLDAARLDALRRSALMHDIGKVGIATGVWNKPGPLTASEWEQVRQHTYWTERILSATPILRPLARLAGMHHERLDGSGYHRGAPAVVQTSEMRLLAAADVYHACTEPRPHRPAMRSADAAAALRADVAAGRLDGEAVDAVLQASGEPARRVRAGWPAGLTDREVEVLRLLARGHSNNEMAKALFVSLPTVKHHVLHIYAKAGVATRAGATLFAMENGLVHD